MPSNIHTLAKVCGKLQFSILQSLNPSHCCGGTCRVAELHRMLVQRSENPSPISVLPTSTPPPRKTNGTPMEPNFQQHSHAKLTRSSPWLSATPNSRLRKIKQSQNESFPYLLFLLDVTEESPAVGRSAIHRQPSGSCHRDIRPRPACADVAKGCVRGEISRMHLIPDDATRHERRTKVYFDELAIQRTHRYRLVF